MVFLFFVKTNCLSQLTILLVLLMSTILICGIVCYILFSMCITRFMIMCKANGKQKNDQNYYYCKQRSGYNYYCEWHLHCGGGTNKLPEAGVHAPAHADNWLCVSIMFVCISCNRHHQ